MKTALPTLSMGPRRPISVVSHLVITVGLWLMVNPTALAASCNYIPKGGPRIWSFEFTRNISGAQNQAGRLEGPVEKNDYGLIHLDGCTCNLPGRWDGYYQATSPRTVDSEGFQKVNEYLSIKTEIWLGGGVKEYVVVPFLRRYIEKYACDTPSDRGGSFIKATFRIDRPFLGMTPIPVTLVADFYSSMKYEPDITGPIEAKIQVSGTVTVPQSYTINAGQIVTVEFNSIPSTAFRQAGARAVGVSPVSRNLGIKCSNIDAQAQLTMRVQADNSVGDAIVSDNKDVGFEVTDQDNRALTPNSLTSVIPFRLDDQAAAQVALKVFPVSLTGKLPEPGPVMARGYLRIDFD